MCEIATIDGGDVEGFKLEEKLDLRFEMLANHRHALESKN